MAGTVTVFFPAGGAAVLLGEEGTQELLCGVPLLCPEGVFQLRIHHPDYRPYEASVRVGAGTELVLLPRMQMSEDYALQQAEALEPGLRKIQKTRRALQQTSRWNFTLALAAAAVVGGLEWLLADKKNERVESYQRYLSASAAEAPAIWSAIQELDAQIGALRLGETIALAASGAFLTAGATTAWSRPSTQELDHQLRLLRERQEP